MELIDRAKVERITFQEPSYSDPINVLTEVRDKVRALPAVDAIPVEWINKYTNEHRTYMHAFSEMVACWYEREEE